VKEAIAEAKQREEADVSRILAEENINFVSEEDRQALTEIDGLTGRPLPTDVLHFAVPGANLSQRPVTQFISQTASEATCYFLQVLQLQYSFPV
jgi:hypothetical protein